MRGIITEARPTEVGKIGPMPKPAAISPIRTTEGVLVVNETIRARVVNAEPAVNNTKLFMRNTPSSRLDTSRPVSNAKAKNASVLSA